MKQKLLNWLLKDINRFEVINHDNKSYDLGRIIVHKKSNPNHYSESFKIITSLQDDNKTLKIFI